MFRFLLSCFSVFLVFFISPFSIASTVVEKDVERFIYENGVEAAVAQLFVVGIPTDYKNTAGSSEFKEIVTNLKVGGIMINGYNLPGKSLNVDDRDLAFNNASNLISMIVSADPLRKEYPILVYADFESYSFSSIKYPLMPPPSPLVLSSTGDTKYSYYAGKLAGYQLSQLGVNVILGPVLDIDRSIQGNPNMSIAMRSFSDSKRILVPHAMAFVQGLTHSKVSAFAKHFPSYGSVYGNAHDESPLYNGSIDQLLDDLSIFDYVIEDVEGIMTSHLIVKKSSKTKPVTYNSKFIGDYIKSRERFSDKVLITDDLSDMESSKKYIKDRFGVFGYKESAVSAFKAGHDVLLFSHVTGKKTAKHSDMKVGDVKESIDAIVELVRSDDKYFNQLKTSLGKVLSLKKKHFRDKPVSSFDYEAVAVFEREESFKNTDDFMGKVFRSAITKISNGDGEDLSDYPDGEEILVVGTKSAIDRYNEELGDEHPREIFVLERSYKSLVKVKKRLKAALDGADRVYFSAETTDHINLLDHIRLKSPKNLDKITVFLHASPHLIKPDLLDGVLVFGNFSKNPISYHVDMELAKSEIRAKELSTLALSIANGSMHDTSTMDGPVVGEYVALPTPIFNSKKEKELYNENSNLKEQLVQLGYQVEIQQNAIKEIESKKHDKPTIDPDRIRTMLIVLGFVVLWYYAAFLKKKDGIGYKDAMILYCNTLRDSKVLWLVFLKKVTVVMIIMAILYPGNSYVVLVKDTLLEYVPGFKPLNESVTKND